MAFRIAKLAPCPYCYTRIDPGKLWYRCSGRPAPGKDACTISEDRMRLKALADGTPVLPSFAPQTRTSLRDSRPLCTHCQGPTGTRVCPNCHSVLPDNFTAAS